MNRCTHRGRPLRRRPLTSAGTVRHISADLGRRARVTFVFAGLAGLFPLGNYLSDNSTRSIERRYSRENAAVIAAVPEAYAANAYPACGPLEDDDEVAQCTVPASRRVIQSTPDSGAVILLIAD